MLVQNKGKRNFAIQNGIVLEAGQILDIADKEAAALVAGYPQEIFAVVVKEPKAEVAKTEEIKETPKRTKKR